jgi:hypothetical protein
MNLTCDHSSASENGIKAAFPKDDVFSADCTFHASPAYWSKDHHALWSNGDNDYILEMKDSMNADFNYLKNCPDAHLVPHMKEAMVEYWHTDRGEEDIADAWMSTYKDSILSRVLLCANYALRGGMPADNNITKRGNRMDKDDLKHKKCDPLKFIELTVMKLSNESSMQLDYHGRMKQSIHSSKFMEAVFMTLEGNRNGRPCLLNMQVPFTYVQH